MSNIFNSEQAPSGLTNFTMTMCYYNSVLQCLSRTPNFVKMLLDARNPRNNNSNIIGTFTSVLGITLDKVISGKKAERVSAITYNRFIKNEKYFYNLEQHDTHECLKAVLRLLNEEKFVNTDTIFQGMLRISRHCLRCHDISSREEALEDISLCITDEEGCTIEDSLNSYMAEELLSDLITCDSCTAKCKDGKPVRSAAKLQQAIFKPPQVLVLNLRRYAFVNGYLQKTSIPVTYSELLDLSPYCQTDSSTEKVLYSLYGMTVHYGISNRGHYVAYIKGKDSSPSNDKSGSSSDEQLDHNLWLSKNPFGILSEEASASSKSPIKENSWYCMNDSYVTKCSLEEVLNEEPNMLFYERI